MAAGRRGGVVTYRRCARTEYGYDSFVVYCSATRSRSTSGYSPMQLRSPATHELRSCSGLAEEADRSVHRHGPINSWTLSAREAVPTGAVQW